MKSLGILGLLAALLVSMGTISCSDDNLVAPYSGYAVQFVGLVSDDPFACGTYNNIGTGNDEFFVDDFRFFVYDVQLRRADNDALVALDLSETPWQHDGLALIDFETGVSGGCNGTIATNTLAFGTAPEVEYDGVCFTMGVPFEMNHIDAGTAPAPLNSVGMQWNWNGGYKFLRIDGQGDPNGSPVNWNVHLGSTSCTPTGDPSTPAISCDNPNRVQVCLDSYDPDQNVIAADIGDLLSGADVGVNTAATAAGCMSAPDDPECPAVFDELGLDHQVGPFTDTDGQGFFSVQ
ncbi:MAG: metallo-mystery pair system four-Cys motif protein [Chrysiogenetes bacterium]|nr:metallo-mystery pair system four-Cys motif protein [Chrysiogenetes bacterium]